YVVVTPSGRVYCIDPGRDYNGRLTLVPFLKRHIRAIRIEAVLLTHYHYDHVGGVPWLIRGFGGRVGAVYSSGVRAMDHPEDLEKQADFDAAMTQYSIPDVYVKQGDHIDDPDVQIDILS